jgi:ribonuclease HI
VTLPPSDRELLRSIYRHLDMESLLEAHPGLTRENVVDLFRRLSGPGGQDEEKVIPRSHTLKKSHSERREESHTASTKQRCSCETLRCAQGDEKTASERAAVPAAPGRLILCTDGGSRGNPGPAGFGVVLLDDTGHVVRELSEFIGQATCNEAEYRALIAALETARELGARAVLIRADSQLLVRQINGQYKVKSRSLMPLVLRARQILQEFVSWEAQHVPREMNSRADALANEAMDRGA